MRDSLTNRVAVITGSSRGLGFATAKAYLEAGASVVVSSRSESSVQAALAKLQPYSSMVSGYPCDVGELVQVEALATHALQTFGQLDIWVNNAGISGPYGPTVEVPAPRFKQVLQTNIWGTYHGSLVALRHFLRQDKGKLINILGRGERNLTASQASYGTSKAWVKAFTLTLAEEHKASKVGIFAYNPGLMYTDLVQQVEVMAGHETELGGLNTVMRMWAKPPAEPAQTLVRLASSATDGQKGKVVRETTLLHILRGALGEGLRRLMGRSSDELLFELETVPSSYPGEVVD